MGNYAAATLEAILADRSTAAESSSTKVGLFHVFHGIWITTGSPVVDEGTGALAKAQARLSKLTTNSREPLLHTIEDFTLDEVSEIMQIEHSEAQQLVSLARQEMACGLGPRAHHRGRGDHRDGPREH